MIFCIFLHFQADEDSLKLNRILCMMHQSVHFISVYNINFLKDMNSLKHAIYCWLNHGLKQKIAKKRLSPLFFKKFLFVFIAETDSSWSKYYKSTLKSSKMVSYYWFYRFFIFCELSIFVLCELICEVICEPNFKIKMPLHSISTDLHNDVLHFTFEIKLLSWKWKYWQKCHFANCCFLAKKRSKSKSI